MSLTDCSWSQQPASEPVDNRYTAHGPEWSQTPSTTQLDFTRMYSKDSLTDEQRTRTMTEAKKQWGLATGQGAKL